MDLMERQRLNVAFLPQLKQGDSSDFWLKNVVVGNVFFYLAWFYDKLFSLTINPPHRF